MALCRKFFRTLSRLVPVVIFLFVIYVAFSQFSSAPVLKAPLQRALKKATASKRTTKVALLKIKTNASTNTGTPSYSAFDTSFDVRDMEDEDGEPFVIMIWEHRMGSPGYAANPSECQSNVECQITYANSNTVGSAHAVVFPAGSSQTPKTRNSKQLYTWWSLESLLHTSRPSGHMDGIFNLTMSYKSDSGAYAPYGSINLILRELKKAGETSLEKLLKKKRTSNKAAAWAVSNCYGKRMKYAKSLMNAGLDVDTFGGCFGGRQIGRGRYSESFYEELSHYKFYFSFENSVSCKDYFTEKFWFNGLRSGAVPIVWGPTKEDLLKVAPTKSFIHTSDYSSPKELVKYLQYLMKNETAYAEYLQWRTWVSHSERIEERLRIENRDHDLRSFCKLCSIVQSDSKSRRLGQPVPTRIIKSISDHWWKPERGICHS